MIPAKAYLGDGVYVEFDGNGLVLTTEDGIRTTNRIVLELDVYTALNGYAGRVGDELDAQEKENPRVKGDDDGREYADPRDARDERRS